VQLDWGGESLQLLPDKALFWQRKLTLIIADPHFGKSIAFRRESIPIPTGITADDLNRLDSLLSATKASRLIILGDVIHAKSSHGHPLSSKLKDWRLKHPELNILVVRGNHDRTAGDPPVSWDFQCVDEPFLDPPFEMRHHPIGKDEPASGYVLAGHLHPSVRLVGRAKESIRLPSFIFKEKMGLLPAFGGFTGTSLIRPSANDRVFVIAENSVVAL